jgi:hypothetical protein
MERVENGEGGEWRGWRMERVENGEGGDSPETMWRNPPFHLSPTGIKRYA